MKKNILFITWDGPETTYAEGLFMPIFHKTEELFPDFKFFYLQFTWSKDTSNQLSASNKYNIKYASIPILRKPIANIASLITLISGKKEIKYYIKKWKIDILMPRSTFPAFMVTQLNLNLPILFDADGLPIEERIDFAGLKENGLMHKSLKKIENKIICQANQIITRSEKSIEYHRQSYNIKYEDKFSVVYNGRDIDFFKPNNSIKDYTKSQLNIPIDSRVFLYAGSFGPQYGWDEMLEIFKIYLNYDSNSHFLFLTGSPEKINSILPKNLKNFFTIKKVPFNEIPSYMNIADIAFAIRKPTLSMQGVAPIKLGEYLLMGLPTIASKGIGDTENIITKIPFTFLYEHENPPTETEILEYLIKTINIDNKKIRESAKKFFSLEAAAVSYGNVLKVV